LRTDMVVMWAEGRLVPSRRFIPSSRVNPQRAE
jgi:hypothetical protein